MNDWYLTILGPNFFRTKEGRGMVRCPQCRRCMDFAAGITRRQVRPDVIDAGFACKCGHWTHGFYETPAVEVGRKMLNFMRSFGTDEQKAESEDDWQQVFTLEQERCREELSNG